MPRAKKGGRKPAAKAAPAKKKVEPQVLSESEEEHEAPSPNHAEPEDVADAELSPEEETGNGDAHDSDFQEEDPESEEDYSPKEKKVVKKATPAKKGKAKAKTPTKRKSGRPAAKKSTRTPPAKKARKEESADEEDEDSETEYEVEKILEVRNHKNGSRDFYVKWKGYPASEATWEPESNLTSSQELIDVFLAKLEKVKDLQTHELRVDRKQTQRYFDTKRDQSVRSSRRNATKARKTYHGQDD